MIALEFLDKSDLNFQPTESYLATWRQVIAMIIANRTPGDGHVLINLGDQLAAFGKASAAHVWYFAGCGMTD